MITLATRLGISPAVKKLLGVTPFTPPRILTDDGADLWLWDNGDTIQW